MLFDKYFIAHNCLHEWRITHVSNAVQFDSTGYPMRLVIERCYRCGKSEQAWRGDGSSVADQLKNGDLFHLEWRTIEDYASVGGV